MKGDETSVAKDFEEHRPLLFSIAYRMLGSATDAEDVLQEAYLRWREASTGEIRSPQAYLSTVVTRLCIDHLRRLKARREDYTGPWLPEPIATEADAAGDAELAESLSMAMLVVLETLSPLERAVFVLREAFGFPYAEIAGMVDRSEAAVRQLARRAREHVRARRPRFEADPEARLRATERFLEAVAGGDLEALMEVLAPDVVLIADGGGKARAPRRPLYGAEKVARFLRSISTREKMALFLRSVSGEPASGVEVGIAWINGAPGVVATSGGRTVSAVVLDVSGGRIRTIHLVANPDKLARVRGT